MIEKLNEVRSSFENQLKEIDQKIITLKAELEKLEEYKIKLHGGIETLDILSPSESDNESQETIEEK